MSGSWNKMNESTMYSGGDFVRRYVNNDEYRYKIIGPSALEGFLKLVEIGKNGKAHLPEEQREHNFAGWFLIEEGFEIFDEGLPQEDEWPRTLDQAVARLKKVIDDETIKHMRLLSPDDFHRHYSELALFIRNQFGLWRGNSELLNNVSPEEPEPDYVSSLIVAHFYNNLIS